MQKLVITELPPVARTLLIPLAYRAIESQRSDALLRDQRALELVFDALNPLSIWMHKLNPALRKTGARLHWGLRNGKVLEEWDADISLLEEWYYFDHGEPRLGVYNLLRYFPLLARANYIVRYQLGENTENPL